MGPRERDMLTNIKEIMPGKLYVVGLGYLGNINGDVMRFATENSMYVYDVRDLSDVNRNSIDEYAKKIHSVNFLLKRGDRVIIGCSAGVSRSMAIAVGVLATLYGYSFQQAVDLVNSQGANIRCHHLEALREILMPTLEESM